MSCRSLVVVVGPFPPPFHGQSKNTQLVADALSDRCDLVVANTSGGRANRNLLYHITKMARVVRALFLIGLNSRKRRKSLYLAADGGFGLFYNILECAIARISGYRIVCHYRSFSYIERYSYLMAGLVAAAGAQAIHVFLCKDMAQKFRRRYPLARDYLVVSNAGHTRPLAERSVFRRGPQGTFTVGLLSNLCPEKGLYDFIELLRVANHRGLHVRGILAGPAPAAQDRIAIANAEKELAGILQYIGPVYGNDKGNFFHSIDIFLFPTRYPVEAQPNVLFESLSHGVPVISYDRGCVSSDIYIPAGYVIEKNADFVSEALDIIERWIEHPDEYQIARRHALEYMTRKHIEGSEDMERLLSTLVITEQTQTNAVAAGYMKGSH